MQASSNENRELKRYKKKCADLMLQIDELKKTTGGINELFKINSAVFHALACRAVDEILSESDFKIVIPIDEITDKLDKFTAYVTKQEDNYIIEILSNYGTHLHDGFCV